MTAPRKRRIFRPGPQAYARQAGTRLVSSAELRRLFLVERVLERLAGGELIVVVVQNGHPSPPLANEPLCTNSQILEYRTTTGLVVAQAHRYLLPDGVTIGASGMVDPKRVRSQGVLYMLDPGL